MDLVDRQDYYLEPGCLCFSATPLVIRTVLGSCVALCLWDKEMRHGGVSHFVRPWAHTPEMATPRYGNAAAIGLIRLLEEAGSQRAHLMALIAGGAVHEEWSEENVGQANIEAVRRVLRRKGIPIASEDVGGTMGRKIMFDTATGQLVVLKVHKIRCTDWEPGPWITRK